MTHADDGIEPHEVVAQTLESSAVREARSAASM